MTANTHPSSGPSSTRWFFLVIGLTALVVLVVVAIAVVAGLAVHTSGSMGALAAL